MGMIDFLAGAVVTYIATNENGKQIANKAFEYGAKFVKEQMENAKQTEQSTYIDDSID